MADEEHFSDEDYDDEDLLDDWEQFEEQEKKAEEATAHAEEEKKEQAAARAAKRQQRRRRRIPEAEVRDATELSAALSTAHAELMSRAQNKSSAADLVGAGQKSVGPQSLKTEDDAALLVNESAEVIEVFKDNDQYVHYLSCLAHELVLNMKQSDVAKLHDTVTALKAEASKQRKAKKDKKKEDRERAGREDILDIEDRAGTKGGNFAPIADEESFM